MKLKKILFIVNLDSFFLSHRIDIAISAQKNGYEVHLATVFTKHKKKLKKYGFKLYPINISRAGQGILENIKSLNQIHSLLTIIRPDLVHAIGIKPIILGGIACRIRKVSCVVFSITGLGYIFLSEGFLPFLRRLFINFLLKLCFNQKRSAVIFQNKDDLRLLVKATNLNIKKTVLIKGSGICLQRYKFRPIITRKQIPIILFASRLLIDKGIYEFVEAAKIVKSKIPAKFIVAGKLDYENPSGINISIINHWMQKGLINYIGYKKDIRNTIYQSYIVVLPSYGEGFPKILIEAAACGKPIVTTDVPGCRDSIILGKTGLLVNKKNAIELAAAILHLIDNKKKYIGMCKNARKFAENSFDIREVVIKHLHLYKKINKF